MSFRPDPRRRDAAQGARRAAPVARGRRWVSNAATSAPATPAPVAPGGATRAVLGCVVLLAGAALAGCGGHGGAGASPRATVASASRQPAAEAGGACQLLDYDLIQQKTGLRFDIAAAGSVNSTYTCVLQPAKDGLPDLSLSVAQTQADTAAFKASVQPKGATSVGDLGKIGYSVAVNAAGGAGPGLEIGWLSGTQRIVILRYRSPSGTNSGTVKGLLPKLVSLAQRIDLATA